MAYPTNYQDAEHRRALNAILDDLHTIEDAQPTEGEDSAPSIGDDPRAQECAEHERQVPVRADAELQVRSTRLSAVRMTSHTSN